MDLLGVSELLGDLREKGIIYFHKHNKNLKHVWMMKARQMYGYRNMKIIVVSIQDII